MFGFLNTQIVDENAKDWRKNFTTEKSPLVYRSCRERTIIPYSKDSLEINWGLSVGPIKYRLYIDMSKFAY